MLVEQHIAEEIGRNNVKVEMIENDLAVIVVKETGKEIVKVAGILNKSAKDVAEIVISSARKAYGEPTKVCE